MKNWEKLEADENLILSKHYTSGRGGDRVRFVVIHHNAGNLSIRGCYDTWQTRKASAHYQVQGNGRIGQLVWDRDTAWHAGDSAANRASIGIEHANNNSNPWTVSEATLENGAHLVAAVCRYFGLGEPRWGVNVYPHSHFSATGCPGELQDSQKAPYMERAQYWYHTMTGKQAAQPAQPAQAQSSASGDIESLARAVIRGDYGNGSERKRRLGDKYNAVQSRVNQILGADGSSSSSYDVDALARAVIRGDYGNGAERKRRLGDKYATVQARVNQILGASGSSSSYDVDALARAVIRGDYGNGEERKHRLGDKYDTVQARVNQLLGA